MTETADPHRLTAPDETRRVITGLVERYRRDADEYARGSYKEAQVREEFINPFFEALGWDLANKAGYAEPYKEVIHEDTIKVGGATKAPDYCFRIGGQRKFFLEAKKPSVHIKTDPSPAYQLRRYGWSAKLPLSILTDFEEFAVYDCSKRPQEADGPAVARVDFVTYDQYLDRLDDIYSIFAKEAILKGSFDRYAEGTRRKRGTTEVDAEFLGEIEAWREMLAKDIARHNPGLSVHELNFAVQTTIDRILFFRIAEDRGVEPYGRLRDLLDGAGLYPRLCQLYQQADTKYNAGLFDFSAGGDQLTRDLEVSDKALDAILAQLYYPQCPYEFSVIGADILGAVYEQFLGKVIRLTKGHQAKVEDKPEVKKAGGVYYTPTYIVDYIVEHTVGEALQEAKTPEAAGKLRILDPACGSGSFLLGAYQRLLDWHLDYYTGHSPKKYARGKQPTLVQVRAEEWRLSSFERKRILQGNIYGVDIDSQAVEVTKLNLLLKCLEGATEQTLAQQLQIFHEPALPNLADNIKCGNSLIGPDYYEGRQLALLDEDESRRVNAFDWEAEFADIMAAGGFDCVIGNPPYGIVFDDETKVYIEELYQTFARNNDTYVAFSEKAVELLKPGGLFGYIIPSTFLLGPYFDDLKRHIIEKAEVRLIVDFGMNQVFTQPNVFTVLLFLQRKTSSNGRQEREPVFLKVTESPAFPHGLQRQTINRDRLRTLRWVPADVLVEKFEAGEMVLDDVAWVKDVGLNYWTKGRGKKRGGSIADRVLYEGLREHAPDRPYLKGKDVARYSLTPGDHWLRHNYNQLLDPKVDTFRFSPEFIEREKIVYRQTADRIIATIDPDGFLINKTLHSVVLKDECQGEFNLRYLLGLLNSRFLTYVYRARTREEGRTFAQVKVFRIKQLPIRTIDFDDPADVARHTKMVELVETMLELHKRLAQVKTPRSRERLQRQIAATDQAIDELVYELYELTDEEIAIVEDSAKQR